MVSIAHFQLQYSKSEMGFRSRSLMSTTTDPPVVNVNVSHQLNGAKWDT